MSLVPLTKANGGSESSENEYLMINKDNINNYNGNSVDEEEPLIIEPETLIFTNNTIDVDIAELVYCIIHQSHRAYNEQPQTNPRLPPEKRKQRHRNYYVWCVNEFVSHKSSNKGLPYRQILLKSLTV